MKIFEEKKDCCGCGACASACPKDAIAMKPDEEGFLYPIVDESRCVNCGRCVRLCPQKAAAEDGFHQEPKFYIAHNNDEEIVKRSASGGAFTALSNVILGRGGVVYGAVFDERFNVVHGRAETPEERDRMCGSKYVQSDMGDIYRKIREDAAAGRPVLFTGTPCQTAGVRAYLGREYENVILCDVICHSVPSPLMWQEYLHMLERESGGKISRVNFRDKTEGWQRASTFKGFRYAVDGGLMQQDDRFYKLFFGWKTIARPSCAQCRYACVRRISDITIADYWGVEKYAPEWVDYYGVSFVMASTEKGSALLHESAGELRYAERDPEEQIRENHRLRGPMGIPADERAAFWQVYQARGFETALSGMKI